VLESASSCLLNNQMIVLREPGRARNDNEEVLCVRAFARGEYVGIETARPRRLEGRQIPCEGRVRSYFSEVVTAP